MHVAFSQNHRAGVALRMGGMSVRLLKLAGAAAMAVVMLFPGVAHAQATLAGALRDTSGAVLPGVTVEAVEHRAHRGRANDRDGWLRAVQHRRAAARHL